MARTPQLFDLPGETPPFDRLGKLAGQVLGVSLTVVVVLEGHRVFFSEAEGFGLPLLSPVQTHAGTAFAQQLAASGTVTVVSDTTVGPLTRESLWLRATGIRSFVAQPIRAPGGELLGSLCVADVRPRHWSHEDLDVLVALADLAASKVTLRSAAHHADAIAVLLQRSMLTDLPDVRHVELVARYLPAQDSAKIGGDWYDAFVLPDGVTALVIGDVAGHDMPAAAQMGQLRNLLRGIAWHTNPSPHAALSALDTTAYGLGVTDLATAIYGRIEESTEGGWQLRWANAGHPPPLLVLADGTARFLDEPSGLLIAFGDSSHRDGIASLPPLATLLLYTDGLVESRKRDIDHGLNRLLTVATDAADLPLSRLCDHVLGELAGVANEDDVTLLAVRIPAVTA
ncbi:hypothetical protein acdb102_24320 [Acidothermaceae bacterium B102]|nr:hypothetical protein acdb102_24320 [Acidothermaceae bacterium B102]